MVIISAELRHHKTPDIGFPIGYIIQGIPMTSELSFDFNKQQIENNKLENQKPLKLKPFQEIAEEQFK